MRMPTLNELIAAGEELFKWGIGIAMYLIITILIGLTIITFISLYHKPITKFIK